MQNAEYRPGYTNRTGGSGSSVDVVIVLPVQSRVSELHSHTKQTVMDIAACGLG